MSKPERIHTYQSSIMNSDRWDSYLPRNDDIIISTSYKAGTTWMQGICSALVFQQPHPPKPLDDLSPWFDANFAPVEEVVAQIELYKHRRYIKTHCPLDGCKYFEELKYIYVGRDGRDVFASMWNHWNNMQPDFIHMINDAPDRVGPEFPIPGDSCEEAFDTWLSKSTFPWESEGYPFWSHLHHAKTWWAFRHLPNIHFIHFSDLLEDLDGEMRKLSAYLDIPVNEDIWPTLLQGVTFKEMKANAATLAPAATQGLWKDNSKFFDKGTNQRWKGLITEEQSQRYEEHAARVLAPELNEWLAKGSLASGV